MFGTTSSLKYVWYLQGPCDEKGLTKFKDSQILSQFLGNIHKGHWKPTETRTKIFGTASLKTIYLNI